MGVRSLHPLAEESAERARGKKNELFAWEGSFYKTSMPSDDSRL